MNILNNIHNTQHSQPNLIVLMNYVQCNFNIIYISTIYYSLLFLCFFIFILD